MAEITLDQLKVFVCIAELGSFAAAARHLNRTQSAITYAVQKLESQTGLILFDRDMYRPTLTRAGHLLLPYAQKVQGDVSEYWRKVAGISRGLEASVTIAVSQFVSPDPVIDTLIDFQEQFPTVRVELMTQTIQRAEVLDDGRADIAIMPEFLPMGSGYIRYSCGAERMVAVAAPDHPLAAQQTALYPTEMQKHLQIMVSGRIEGRDKRNYALQTPDFWKTDDLNMKKSMILRGAGWGALPEYMVCADIRAGRLVELSPVEWDGLDQLPELRIVVAYRRDKVLGPAGLWFARALSQQWQPE
ncbi:LysR family transcriptional regulator [Thalassospira sp. TSL5-1]|uniref:LysR family transcriptional regulator n=1 Tax=Thalassospira sp. TSL5-1 TaxID=1544451 RepID=UPI00093A1F1F|nr:LysR family transcriptional regulator [Thalassospira sp. TSL5-1]OKH87955.1 transcriptional regulator [Thalassospira sp. TSL5-1]